MVDNTATATGTDPNDTDVTDTDTVSTPIPASPDISLDKQAGVPSGNSAGDSIDYTFLVTNTGNVTLDPVNVDDPTANPVTCPVTVLAPGESTTCTATYTLTQVDVDAGHVANTATVTGTDPHATEVTAVDSTDVAIPASPGISLDKQAGVPSGNSAGDSIDYTFLVTNTGNVTLDPVSVDDPTANPVTCPVNVLAPGESTTCTATYSLSQADVNAGHVANTATATGSGPTGNDVTGTDSTDVPITSGPAITMVKSAVASSGDAAGSAIDYTFLVTNIGNVTLDPVSVDDPTANPVTCPVTVLAPGESTTCTATYTLTQADVDAGRVDNTATATGTDPTGTDVTATDSTVWQVLQTPSVALDKQASAPSNSVEGGTIDYTLVVTNTGNVTLDPVSVDDPLVNPVNCPATALAPGTSMTCTASYTLTQADVDVGIVDNTATATGTSPIDDVVTAEDSVSVPIDQTPGISLVKRADTTGPVGIGDQITYSFLVTNTGNVTLSGIRVDDPMLGPVTCAATTLAPRGSTTCTAPPYSVTAQDVRDGRVINSATAYGSGAGGVEVSATDQVVISTASPEPGITLVKRADTAGPVAVGDTITYTFTVTNTGNVRLRNVVVHDAKLGTVTCEQTRLDPGESTTCTAKPYTVTAADVQSGNVVNHASVTASACGSGGTQPCTRVSDADSVILPTAHPSGLPDTGSPVSPAAPLAALVMLAAGIGLLLAGRHKRRATD